MTTWDNYDGLKVRFPVAAAVDGQVNSAEKTIRYHIADATAVPSADAVPDENQIAIPAGAFITRAYLVVKTAFTSGGSATLDIGLVNAAGTAVDHDGIDAAVALAALAANKAVVADGASVGGTVTYSSDTYVQATYNTAAFTAGAAYVDVVYIEG